MQEEREVKKGWELQEFINTLMETRVKALEEGQKDINNRLTRFESKQDSMLELMTEFKEENKNRSKQRDSNFNSAVMTIITAAITGIVGYILAFIFTR